MATRTAPSDHPAPAIARLEHGVAHLHPYRFEGPAGAAAHLLGVGPDDGLRVGHGRLVATYGRWTLDTPVANIASVEVTGPYRLHRVAGPPHLSFSDRGVTFATTTRAGVCIGFAEPVRAIEPTGMLRHPSLTITVADPESVRDLLQAYLDESKAR